jgi:hypothetical protein
VTQVPIFLAVENWSAKRKAVNDDVDWICIRSRVSREVDSRPRQSEKKLVVQKKGKMND